jgi:hypothetical protein
MVCFLKLFDCWVSNPQTLYEIALEQEQDRKFQQAKENYRRAAEKGHVLALYKLGTRTYNEAENIFFFNKTKGGDSLSKPARDNKYISKLNEAKNYLNQAAQRGAPDARNFLQKVEKDDQSVIAHDHGIWRSARAKYEEDEKSRKEIKKRLEWEKEQREKAIARQIRLEEEHPEIPLLKSLIELQKANNATLNDIHNFKM